MNKFKVGDKVELKHDTYGFLAKAGFRMGKVYTVKEVDTETDRVYVKETLGCIHYTHFELYKEPTQEKQPMKTKHIPFSEDSWTKNRTCSVFWKPTNTVILYFNRWLDGHDSRFIGVCKATESEYCATTFSQYDFSNMELEIPVTTKRIPFDASRKDAKVLLAHANSRVELIEWVQMEKSSVVVGVTEDKLDCGGFFTAIYHPNDLEMEIEE